MKLVGGGSVTNGATLFSFTMVGSISQNTLIQDMDVNKIYGSLLEQKSAVETFLKIDKMRKKLVNNLLPVEVTARTQDN